MISIPAVYLGTVHFRSVKTRYLFMYSDKKIMVSSSNNDYCLIKKKKIDILTDAATRRKELKTSSKFKGSQMTTSYKG